MADVEKAIGSNWRIFMLCAVLLILNALWRVLVPAHEYSSSGAVWLQLAIDIGLMVGLVGLYRQLSAILSAGDSRRGPMTLLFWPGMVAGIVVFLIRLTSDEGWWTGHLRYVVE